MSVIDNCLFYGGISFVLIGMCLTCLGFKPSGIVKGSIAAAIQSGIGLVKAGSWFAYATHLAMKNHPLLFIITGMMILILRYLGYLDFTRKLY